MQNAKAFDDILLDGEDLEELKEDEPSAEPVEEEEEFKIDRNLYDDADLDEDVDFD